MKEEIQTVYKVNFNDFGEVYILAQSFREAEELFLQTKFGGDHPNIKEISLLGRGISKESFLTP